MHLIGVFEIIYGGRLLSEVRSKKTGRLVHPQASPATALRLCKLTDSTCLHTYQYHVDTISFHFSATQEGGITAVCVLFLFLSESGAIFPG
eukprot:COSAG02_NODE_4277_length_5558_cov_8.385968_4_plen_91_part_00